jgi:hypothetical protein
MFAKNILSYSADGTMIIMKTSSINFRGIIKSNFVKISILFIAIVYILIVSKIAEQMEARYIYGVYPSVALLSIVVLDKFFEIILSKKIKNKLLVLIIVFLIILGFYNKKQYLEYFYPLDTAAIAKTYSDSKFIMVSLPEGWLPINAVTFAAENNTQGYVIYAADEKDIERKLVKPLSQIDDYKDVIVYISIARSDSIWISYWRPELLKRQIVKDKVFEVIKKSGFTDPKFLFSGFCFEAYWIKRK